MMKRAVFSVVILFSLMSSGLTLAFETLGHDIVSELAESRLSPVAKREIMTITNGEGIKAIANWADEVRADKENWNYTKYWHFISIDDDESFDDFRRSEEGDILTALVKFEAQLRDETVTGQARWQALAFYIHLIADIHQPVHVGRWEDHGGNRIKVSWFEQESSLHAIWDEGLIVSEDLGSTVISEYLATLPVDQIEAWQNSPYLDWAKESKALRKQVYDFGVQSPDVDWPELNEAYSSKNRVAITQRLAQASVRLAHKLNQVFSAN